MNSRSYAPESRPSSRTGVRATAAVTTLGAAAAALIAASPADAHASYAVWDRVAACESSGNWHINTGNGYYGGLQFSAGTWAAYHGHKYAAEANGASRLEQIEVARRVLEAQGPGAWPVCGPRAGLSRSSGSATSAPLPTVEHSAVRRAHHKARHHKARHHKARHAARHHATHKAARHTYRVRSGDTLSKIASRLHIAGGWRELYRLNRSHISNPNVIHVGQLLRLP
jgi:nucleoid-associated protein YgaU